MSLQYFFSRQEVGSNLLKTKSWLQALQSNSITVSSCQTELSSTTGMPLLISVTTQKYTTVRISKFYPKIMRHFFCLMSGIWIMSFGQVIECRNWHRNLNVYLLFFVFCRLKKRMNHSGIFVPFLYLEGASKLISQD